MSEPAPPASEALADPGERLAPLGLIVSTVTQLPQLFLPIVAALFGTRDTEVGFLPLVAVIIAASLVARWIGWTRFRYFVTGDAIRVERGLIGRTARSIPYQRIADVSIEQPALARMLGLAVVRFETGAGKGDEAELRFVSEAEAERLREMVRARKVGAPGAGEAAALADDDTPAPLLFAMDQRRLLTLGFYSFSLVIFAVLFGLAQQLDFLLPFDWQDIPAWIGLAEASGIDLAGADRAAQAWGIVGGLAALVAVGFATGIVRTVLSDYGFRLERTAKGLRRRRGLLTHTDVTVPAARVQAALIGTGPVRLRRGWYDLRLVSLASESAKDSHHMVAPLARLEEIWPILAEVRIASPAPELNFVRAHPAPWLYRAALVAAPFAVWAAIAWVQGLAAAPWLALPGVLLAARVLLQWRQERCAIDAGQLYAWAGWWNRRLTLGRQLNVQSVSITRGPFERIHGLASLHFGIPGGALSFRALPHARTLAIRDQVLAVIAPVDFARLSR